MSKTHEYKFAPLLIGAEKRYEVGLPSGASPVVYKTMTTSMRSWPAELVKFYPAYAAAAVRGPDGKVTEVRGRAVSRMALGQQCIVMEHLNIDGGIDFFIGNKNILQGDQNFVNFGSLGGKHVRIDIYTGESRIIE